MQEASPKKVQKNAALTRPKKFIPKDSLRKQKPFIATSKNSIVGMLSPVSHW